MGIYLTELQWTRLAGKMTLAQVSDVIFLFLLPFMLKSLGYKKTILLGILAWAARYFLLAGSVNSGTLQTTFIFVAILLHGVCYDFLFIAGQLYADNEANERIRGATQGFMAFILWGVGAFVGTMLAGKVLAMHTYTAPQGSILHDWQSIWLAPAVGAVVVLILFALLFKEPARPVPAPK
jgi:MFS family permease